MKILLQNCLLHKICKIKSTVALHYLFVKIFKLSNGTGQVRRPHVLQLGLYSSDLTHTCGLYWITVVNGIQVLSFSLVIGETSKPVDILHLVYFKFVASSNHEKRM